MHALKLRKYGSPDYLDITDVPAPVPADNELLVRIRAASLNDWDWGLLNGVPFIPNRLMAGLLKPHITPGSDIAGEVVEVGRHVTAFKAGDRVYGDLSAEGFGGFAEYVCAPHHALRMMSPEMDFVDAAAIPQAGILALQAVDAGGMLTAGQSVLVNGAGGGVGSIAIQLLRQQHVTVTGVDSADKHAAMQTWGYDTVIDYQRHDFTQLQARYDLIIDTKTLYPPAQYARVLTPTGRYVTVGGHIGPLLRMALAGSGWRRFGKKSLKVIALQPNRDLSQFNARFEAGRFRPVIDSEFAFTSTAVRKAFAHFGKSAHKGKIIIRMPSAEKSL